MKPGRHKIKISKSLQTRIRKGHPWVHFYEIKKDIENAQPGDLGVVYDASNRFLALGLYDPYSDIRLRVLQTGQPVTVDEDFFRNRLVKALALRQELESEGTTGYRVINGENDGFPGLVMDRYDNTLVIKLYTSAWFPYMEELAEVIQDCLPQERAVVLLSRHVSRLPDARAWHEKMLFGSMVDAPVLFSENGLLFEADILKGQKTGFFRSEGKPATYPGTFQRQECAECVQLHRRFFRVCDFGVRSRCMNWKSIRKRLRSPKRMCS